MTAAAESGVAGLPVETAQVLSRWNPDAVKNLRGATEASDETQGVYVAGPKRAGKSALVEELGRLSSGDLAFVDDPAEAAVVLMVLDASAALGREELAVLDVAAQPASTVVFALNKTDVHRDWPSVAARNAVLLADHAPRFAQADLHPVSARPASGLGDLLLALESAVAADPESTRRRNTASAARAVVEQTGRMIAAKAQSLREADIGAAIRAERAQLLAHRDGQRAERIADLRSQGQLAKVELLHEVANQVRGAGSTARTEIDRADRTELAAYPQHLTACLGELTRRVDFAMSTRLAEMSRRLGVSPPAVSELPEPMASEGPETRHRGLEDRMTILIGASAGLGLGRLAVSPLSMVPPLEFASVPATLALGAAVAWWLTRARGHIAERAHVRQWAAEALANARSQLEQRVLGRLLETEAAVSAAVIAASRARALHVDERVAEIDGELRKLAAQRSGQLSACERDLAALERGLRHTDRNTENLESAIAADQGTDRAFRTSITSSTRSDPVQ